MPQKKDKKKQLDDDIYTNSMRVPERICNHEHSRGVWPQWHSHHVRVSILLKNRGFWVLASMVGENVCGGPRPSLHNFCYICGIHSCWPKWQDQRVRKRLQHVHAPMHPPTPLSISSSHLIFTFSSLSLSLSPSNFSTMLCVQINRPSFWFFL